MNAVSGLNITNTVRVESVEHLSDLLREASDSNTPVIPVGGGTCLSTGLPTDHEFLALDLSGLSGIVDYTPTDMTAGFLAGTPLSTVRETLADNGQELPIDLAPDDAGTIGGLVATGFSGPRRYSQGTLKDLLIGSEYVRGDGLIAKAGGMTVKNVSGFEISRMLHGSWGSLAVLTRVNLKVIPKARVDRTLVWQDAEMEHALARQERLLAQFPSAGALQTVQGPDGWDTAIRFSGREPAVDDYEKKAISLEGEPESVSASAAMWAPGPSSEESAQLVLSATAADIPMILANLVASGGAAGISVSFGTGTIRATLIQDVVTASHLTDLGSPLWMIEGGHHAWKRDLPIWGPPRADRAVMQSIRNQFDPAGILNCGRLFI